MEVYRAVPVKFLFSLVGDVKGLRITELLCEAEVDDINLVATLASSHEEIVRLDITMDEVAGMDVFDAGYLGNDEVNVRGL